MYNMNGPEGATGAEPKHPGPAVNRRISRVSRHMAKLALEFRRAGNLDSAHKIEAAGTEPVEAMRGGRL